MTEAVEAPADLAACERALAAARQQSEERWQALLRARADLDNHRKRTAKEKEEARQHATGRLIEALLPVKDSLELALVAAGEPAGAADLHRGVELTLNKLESVFADFGVETLDPRGEPFDPTRHEAIRVAPAAELPADSVSEVHQKGYLLRGRLLRPAAVTVVQRERRDRSLDAAQAAS